MPNAARFTPWLPLVAAALAAAPVLLSTYPPMTDLPAHESLVALLRTHGDTSKFPPGFLVFNLGQPNQLFHLLAWPLTFLVSPTLASKLMAAASAASVPWGTGRLGRYLGASPAIAFAAVPIALGWLFNWGFVNNLLGLGLLLALLPGLDRFVRKPSPRGFAFAVAGMLLLYVAHELLLFVFVGACGVFTLVSSCSLGGGLVRLTPAAVGLTIAAVQIRLQEHLKTATVREVPMEFLWPWRKVLGIPVLIVGGPAGAAKLAVFALWTVTCALFMIRTKRPANPARIPSPLATRLSEHRFELLAIAVLGLYFVAPRLFNGASLVYERFLTPAVLIGLLALAGGPAGSPDGIRMAEALPEREPLRFAWLATGMAATLPVAVLLVVWPAFVDSSRNYEAIDPLLDRIPKGATLASLELEPPSADRYYNLGPAYMRALARSGGRVMYSLADSTVAPVRIAPEYQWDEPALRIARDPPSFRPAYDLTRFRFLLVHTASRLDLATVAAALEPYAKPVETSGEWALFESTLDVVPITTPDAPLPKPAPHTLRYLANQVRAARGGQDAPLPSEPP